MAGIVIPVHDYVAFSYIRETNPAHWTSVDTLTRKYVKPPVADPDEGLNVIGRDGTGVKYQLFNTSDLTYQIMPNTDNASKSEIVLVTGNVGGLTSLSVGQVLS
jgi:hypothetical protein